MKLADRSAADIVDVVEQEQRRLERHHATAGDSFLHAEKAVDILNAAVTRVDKDAQLFGHAWTMVRKDATLALLSTLRGHRVQASLCLRHMLESACIAFYAAAHPDDYCDILKSDAEDLKRQTYRWLSDRYPDASEAIHSFKRHINSLDSHANTDNILLLDDFYSGTLPWAESFFDGDDITMVQTALIDVVDAIAMVLFVLDEIAASTPGVEIDPDTAAWIDEVWRDAAIVREAIVSANNDALRAHYGLPATHVFPWERRA